MTPPESHAYPGPPQRREPPDITPVIILHDKTRTSYSVEHRDTHVNGNGVEEHTWVIRDNHSSSYNEARAKAERLARTYRNVRIVNDSTTRLMTVSWASEEVM